MLYAEIPEEAKAILIEAKLRTMLAAAKAMAEADARAEAED